jgi:hypothetical protein
MMRIEMIVDNDEIDDKVLIIDYDGMMMML